MDRSTPLYHCRPFVLSRGPLPPPSRSPPLPLPALFASFGSRNQGGSKRRRCAAGGAEAPRPAEEEEGARARVFWLQQDRFGGAQHTSHLHCAFSIVLGTPRLDPTPGQKNPLLIDLIIELLKLKTFTKTIGGFVSKQTCTSLDQAVDKNLTAVLQNVAARIRPYMKPPPPIVYPPAAANEIDYRNDSALALFDGVVNNIVGADGPLGVNYLFGLDDDDDDDDEPEDLGSDDSDDD